MIMMKQHLNDNLPYDAQVEYLESDGSAYIDTRHYVSEQLRFEIKGHFTYLRNHEDWLLGDWSSNSCYLAGNYYNSNRCRVGYDNSSCGADIVSIGTDQGVHVWKADDNNCWVDDVKSPSIDWNHLPTTGRKIIIGKSQHTNSDSIRRVYYCKFWNSIGQIVMDFICVRVGDVGCLYDRVSGELFNNVGSSPFMIGPDVRSSALLKGGRFDGIPSCSVKKDSSFVHAYFQELEVAA